MPDQFVDYFVCADSNATRRIRDGQKNLASAINSGIDDCPREFNNYVDFLTRNALVENGVNPANGDPSVRRALAEKTRSQTLEYLLPVYRRSVK